LSGTFSLSTYVELFVSNEPCGSPTDHLYAGNTYTFLTQACGATELTADAAYVGIRMTTTSIEEHSTAYLDAIVPVMPNCQPLP
jgi:hypothetical protein